ncbi:MAG: metallothionein [Cyanobacteria bacterium P01_A01_bin.83]
MFIYSADVTIKNEDNTMTSDSLVKCTCDRCAGEISWENAITKEDKYYCCEACANGHIND